VYRTDNDHVLFLLGEQKEHRARLFRQPSSFQSPLFRPFWSVITTRTPLMPRGTGPS